MEYKSIKNETQKRLKSYFKELGYQIDGSDYFILDNKIVKLVNLQFASSGYSICINLGVNFPEVLPYTQQSINSKKIEVELRRRLTDNLEIQDKWWKIDSPDQMIQSIDDIKVKYSTTGNRYFKQFDDPESFLNGLAMDILSDNCIPIKYKNIGYATELRTYYWLSIYQYKKRNIKVAKELSELGLQKIDGKIGVSLEKVFREIIEEKFV